jgi:transposase-like protein
MKKWTNNKLIPMGICYECGSKNGIHYHHIIPQSLGGNKTIPLCNVCHSKVHDRKFTNFSELVKKGIRDRQNQGLPFGRTKGTVEPKSTILNKKEYHYAITLLKKNKHSIRYIAKVSEISNNTVLKLKHLLVSNGDIPPFENHKNISK